MTNSNKDYEDDKLTELYKQGSNETVPAHLTQHVLNQAKQNIKSTGNLFSLAEYFLQLISSSRGLAFTAVMVIGISIILQIQFDQPAKMIPGKEEALEPLNLKQPADDSESLITEDSAPQLEASQPMSTEPVFEDDIASKKADMQQRSATREHELEKARQQRQRAARKAQESTRKIIEMSKLREAENKRLAKQKLAKPAPPGTQQPSAAFAPLSDENTTLDRAASIDNCTQLSDKACLLSAECTLVYTDTNLSCRASNNHCEKGFIQLQHNANRCLEMLGCGFIPGNCQCSNENNKTADCECDNNQPPACDVIEED